MIGWHLFSGELLYEIHNWSLFSEEDGGLGEEFLLSLL